MTESDSFSMSFRNVPRIALAPLPLPLLQPFLKKVIFRAVRNNSELFRRLGQHSSKTFLIDPTNFPFAFLLCPDPANPVLWACRRQSLPPYDSRISGTFLTLLEMVDGKTDGDSLFFSRDLMVEGDTEAVVVLRNALDDLNVNIFDEMASSWGPIATACLSILRNIKRT